MVSLNSKVSYVIADSQVNITKSSKKHILFKKQKKNKREESQRIGFFIYKFIDKFIYLYIYLFILYKFKFIDK